MTFRFLVIDGYRHRAREKLAAAGCTPAGKLYEAMAGRHAPGCHVDIAYPADGADFLPQGAGLADYDGLLWTGSSLTVTDDRPEVTRQIALAKAAFEAGVPGFGSCWALQIAAVAAGGTCRPNPNGREFGVTRKVVLTPEGRGHPLYAGNPPAFDGFTSHFDEVESLPPGGVVLATNAMTRVQAAAISRDGTAFWALQYHPEYDLGEIAALARLRGDGLIAEGRFRDRDDLNTWIAALETLNDDPDQPGLAWRLGVDADLLDPAVRCCEFVNWLEALQAGTLAAPRAKAG